MQHILVTERDAGLGLLGKWEVAQDMVAWEGSMPCSPALQICLPERKVNLGTVLCLTQSLPLYISFTDICGFTKGCLPESLLGLQFLTSLFWGIIFLSAMIIFKSDGS